MGVVVEGHEGKMVFGYMRGLGESKVPVVLLVGRAQCVVHVYKTQVVPIALIVPATVSMKAIGEMLC